MLLDRMADDAYLNFQKRCEASDLQDKELIDTMCKSFERAYMTSAAISIAKKVAIGAAVLVGGYFLSKKFS